MHRPASRHATRELDSLEAQLETSIYHIGTGAGSASELQLDAGPGPPSHSQELQKWTILAFMALVWVACGLAIYLSEGYSVLDSVYGIVQILSTVGYGDVVPKSQTQKLLTAFLVLTSLVVASGCVTIFLDQILDKQNEVLKAKLVLAENRIRESTVATSASSSSYSHEATDDTGVGGDQSGEDTEALKDHDTGEASELSVFVNFVVFACFLLTGTLFFGLYESCSCGDGPSLVPGCDKNDCEATGGHMKTMVDAFYMSSVTLTTVGFGDETAGTCAGKLFSIFWILFGVGSMINFVGDLTDCIHKTSKFAETGKISAELFQTMDQDGNGTLDRVEFLKLQLVMQGLAQPEEIDTMLRQFDLIDRGNDGNISMEEVKAYYR